MSSGVSNRQFLLWAAAVLLFAGYVLYAAWHWGLPWAAASATKLVPAAWEREVGTSIARSIAPGAKPCLAETAERLERAVPQPNPYRFEVLCTDSPEVNALAAPGGSIVVFRGLLDAAGSDEETAAVLAHEMQHVSRRHATRAIFRTFAIQALAGLVFGDVTGLIAQISGSLGALHYQRTDEDEADHEGVLLLKRAGYDPEAMATMLENLDAATRGEAALPVWLSSHPDTQRRIARTRELARGLD